MGFFKSMAKEWKQAIKHDAKYFSKLDKLTGKGYHCKDCKYKWVSRKEIGKPSKCPDCNSRNIKKIKLEQLDIGKISNES